MRESGKNFFETHRDRDSFEDNPIKAMEVAEKIRAMIEAEKADN